MNARRLREWPRLVAGAVALAAVLVGIGLLVGAEALGSRTTTTTTTTVQRAAAATTTTVASRADQSQIVALRRELSRARARLRAAHRAHPTHSHPHTSQHRR